MNKLCLVSIMLFAMQHNMVNCSIVDVIKLIDKERGIISRIDFLKIVFEDAVYEYNVHDVSFGVYDKYLYIYKSAKIPYKIDCTSESFCQVWQ